LLSPLYHALGAVLALYYDHIVANYAGAIALLTITVMALVTPLTIRSARSAAKLQALQPDLKKLRTKHRNDRAKLNEELFDLYRTHGVHPVSGLLPSLVPLPVFYVLYRVVRGLANVIHVHGKTVAAPLYLDHHTRLYVALVLARGHLPSLGIDLARSAITAHGVVALAYWAIVGLVFVVQYVQARQLRARRPAPIEGPLAHVQRLGPWLFVAVAAVMSAALNIYFVVSGAMRIVQTYAINAHLKL
jgi:YidC/Oxa1 family membrane protein insertase